MNRRAFLGSGTALLVIGMPRFAHAETNDWSAFELIAGAITSLLHATDPLAAVINRERFRFALSKLREKLHGLHVAKLAAQSALAGTPCEGARLTTEAALTAAIRDIGRLLPELANATRDLTLLVKPPEIVAKLDSAARGLARLRAPDDWIVVEDRLVLVPGTKGKWTHLAVKFCDGTEARKKTVRRDVATSLKLITDCASLCAILWDRL